MAGRGVELVVLLAAGGVLAAVEGLVLGVVGGLVLVWAGVDVLPAALGLALSGLAVLGQATPPPLDEGTAYDVYEV